MAGARPPTGLLRARRDPARRLRPCVADEVHHGGAQHDDKHGADRALRRTPVCADHHNRRRQACRTREQRKEPVGNRHAKRLFDADDGGTNRNGNASNVAGPVNLSSTAPTVPTIVVP